MKPKWRYCSSLFQLVLNFYTTQNHPIFYKIFMNFRTAAKIVPNLFSCALEEDQFTPSQLHTSTELFRQSQNHAVSKNSRKKERKPRTPKMFIQADNTEQQNLPQTQNKQNNEFFLLSEHSSCEQPNAKQKEWQIKHKPRFLLDLHLQQEPSEVKSNSETSEEITQTPANDGANISCANMKNLHLMDWVSDTEGDQAKTAGFVVPYQQENIDAKKQVEPLLDCYPVTKQCIFQPILQSNTLKCFVRRDKKNAEGVTEYNVYFQHNLQHVLTIKKQGIWKYSLYFRQSRPGPHFIYDKVASLSSTFFGNHFSLIKQHEKYSSLTVSYQTNLLGLNGPRKIRVYRPNKAVPFEYLNECENCKQWENQVTTFVNRDAVWDQKLKAFTLDFKGRASKSSIKNFVIVDEKEGENSCIIFGKAGYEVYNLDISYPFSLIQGIAVAISSFERKLTCD